jgi:hypothetical protein
MPVDAAVVVVCLLMVCGAGSINLLDWTVQGTVVSEFLIPSPQLNKSGVLVLVFCVVYCVSGRKGRTS